MVKTEAPALGESRRQQLLPSPTAGAPLLDSTPARAIQRGWSDFRESMGVSAPKWAESALVVP